jgi:hypothetical protein
MANERARGLGYKYITDDKYLVNPFSPTEGISYEGDGSPVSYANSGIMTEAPIIYPPVNQGGGDGGENIIRPTGPGSYDSVFDPKTQNKQFNEDIGVGTVAEEDDEKGTSLGIVDALRAMGAFTFGGPLNAGYSLKRSVDRNKQKEIDRINAEIDAQYGPSDPGSRGRDDTPGFGKTAAGNYTNQFEGGDPGLGGDTTGGFDTGGGKEMMAKGGRAGYFFGGRVNYKIGGVVHPDGRKGFFKGAQADTSKGKSMSPGTDASGGFRGGDNNGGNDKTFFQTPTTLYKNTDFGFNVPTGLTTGTPYGRLSAIMNLNKTIEEKELEGKVQFDRSIGPVNTRASYDTTIGPEFNASYTNNNFNANLNSKTGLGVNYSKDIGPGTFTVAGDIDPYGNYNTEARYGISLGRGKKNGGRISFKNGGLASIL